jgi:hypothetical protein
MFGLFSGKKKLVKEQELLLIQNDMALSQFVEGFYEDYLGLANELDRIEGKNQERNNEVFKDINKYYEENVRLIKLHRESDGEVFISKDTKVMRHINGECRVLYEKFVAVNQIVPKTFDEEYRPLRGLL